ncbi:MAG: ATP-binding protein [Candidatus Diapherotrites archaeon]|nr:ATP-binding protein [Candidatus Diapherotrites archaeon]
MKSITVLSGKGGTGKTTILAALVSLLAREHKLVAVDCDVETSNLALFFGLEEKDFKKKEVSATSKAVLVDERCTRCRKCLDSCAFSAISWDGKPVFDKFLCTGCGACAIVCPEDAIKLEPTTNAWIGKRISPHSNNLGIVTGQLYPGESGSGEIVALLKEEAETLASKIGAEMTFLDAPAGVGCPVIASVTGADYVIAVTEPTPPAFRDLQKALAVVEHFRIPYGLVINKADLNEAFTKKIREFADSHGIQVIGELPYDRAFVDALVNLKPVVDYDKRLEPQFKRILDAINIMGR